MNRKIVETSCIPKAERFEPRFVAQDVLPCMVELYKLFQEMIEVCEREKGIGLSAVQIGVPLDVFVVKGDGTCPLIPKGEYRCFVNTTYKPLEIGSLISMEGCLSIRQPNGDLRFFKVSRSAKIKLVGYMLRDDLTFNPIDTQLDYTQQAVVFQHEIDHSRGVLISDIGEETFIW